MSTEAAAPEGREADLATVADKAAKVAQDWLENWGHDLAETADDYLKAKASGVFNGRRIAPGTALQFAREFRERANAVYDCGEQVAIAIRAALKQD